MSLPDPTVTFEEALNTDLNPTFLKPVFLTSFPTKLKLSNMKWKYKASINNNKIRY